MNFESDSDYRERYWFPLWLLATTVALTILPFALIAYAWASLNLAMSGEK